MGAQENIAALEAGYAAFGRGDVDAVMSFLDDEIEWVVRGESAVSGVKRGKREFGAFLAQMAGKSTTSVPYRLIGDGAGDVVVALTHVEIGGERTNLAEVFDFNGAGKIVRQESYGWEPIAERVFGRS